MIPLIPASTFGTTVSSRSASRSPRPILGVSRKTLSELVNGRSGVSPEMAVRLSKAFGGSPEVWLRMQMNFDLWHAQQNADRIKVERYVPA
jgi:addiction module HigA family antidote